MEKHRVMYLLRSYPQLSQTYVNCEINAVKDDYELAVVAMRPADLEDDRPIPYKTLNRLEDIIDVVREFRPHVLHTHYLVNIEWVSAVAHATNTPFTIRAHSFDAMRERWRNRVFNTARAFSSGKLATTLRWVFNPRLPLQLQRPDLFNDDLCLGILVFPYTRPFLQRAGIRSEKLIDCYPVVDYRMFHDTSPNGEGVMNLGAGMRKKQMDDFIHLGKSMPGTQFDLYPIGHITDELRQINDNEGQAITIHKPVQHRDMPAVYKSHRWLCYTASRRYASVGWPIAVAEAQAAGVGVCMPDLRPDLEEFLGGAGFVYGSLDEAKRILSQPLAEEIRQRGFEQAKKSDIANHKHLLTDLWDGVPF